jgi:hypothetical protein
MGGSTNRAVAYMLLNHENVTDTQKWATCACDAHVEALGMRQSFTVDEHATARLLAPRGNIISTVKDPSSAA